MGAGLATGCKMPYADPLAVALNRLRKLDPREFAEVTAALAAYTATVIQNTIDAPADEVLQMQGRAKQARAFLRVFRECHLSERP